MQVGIMSGDIARPTLEETLDAILGHDIRHLQFNLGSLNMEGSLSDKLAKAPVVRAEIEKRGMVIAALAGTVNMVHPDEEKRQEAIEYLKSLIPACDPMGTSVIATCTGSRDSESMWRWHPDNDTEEAWQMLHNTLKQVLPVAEAAGVIIAFEPEINNVASTVHKSRQLIDEMGSPNLKVVMDAANIFGKDDLSRMKEILDEAFALLGDLHCHCPWQRSGSRWRCRTSRRWYRQARLRPLCIVTLWASLRCAGHSAWPFRRSGG